MYKKVFSQHLKGGNIYLVHLWDDEIGYQKIKYRKPAYIETSLQDSQYKGFYGENLTKTYDWSKNDEGLHFHDMTPYQTFLIEKYGTDDTISKHHNVLYYDIEIEMGDVLTEGYIRRAPKPITSIAYYDNTLKHYGVFILDKSKRIKKIESPDKSIIPCSSEEELLAKWIEKFREIDPDILIGYNCWFFDDPYLYYRICKVLGEEYANMLSPINIVQDVSRWSLDKYVSIAGVESLDYMKLHKKYYFKDEPSWTLGDLGLKWVELGKIEYEGNLDILYKNDPDKFVKYNFRDVEILVKWEEKMNYIPLTINISHKGKINYSDITTNSKIHDGAISSYLLSQGITPPPKDMESQSKRNYAGGYLFNQEPGIKKYVSDFDLASLYPSIIISLNTGPNTFVGRILYEDDRNFYLSLGDLKNWDLETEVTVENRQGKIKNIKINKLIKYIEDNNLTISANGVMFRTDINSPLKLILSKWFDQRIEYQRLMKEAFESGDKEEGEHYHLTQHTYKVLLNSVYGCLALASFRYSLPNSLLAESTTLTGQRVITESSRFTNKHLSECVKES